MGCALNFPGYHEGEWHQKHIIYSNLPVSLGPARFPTATLSWENTNLMQRHSLIQSIEDEMGRVSDRASRNEAHYTAWFRQTHQLSKSYGARTCLCAGHGYVVWFYCVSNLMAKIAVNPSQKLDWFEDNMPEKVQEAKGIFVQAVSACTEFH